MSKTITKPGQSVVVEGQASPSSATTQTTIAASPSFATIKHLLRDAPLRRPKRRRPEK